MVCDKNLISLGLVLHIGSLSVDLWFGIGVEIVVNIAWRFKWVSPLAAQLYKGPILWECKGLHRGLSVGPTTVGCALMEKDICIETLSNFLGSKV